MFLREACVSTIQEAIEAEKLGADRIEYCSHLEWDGLTPDFGEVEQLVDILNIPIMVMIRTRKGNFEYSEDEFEEMKAQVRRFKDLGVEGVVFGFLLGQCVNLTRTSMLAEIAFPLQVCFHKAIDEVHDQVSAVKQLAKIPQVTRILTSGGQPTALEGIPMLRKMMEAAGDDLSIMPAGRVTPENIDELDRVLGAKEYHGRKIVG